MQIFFTKKKGFSQNQTKMNQVNDASTSSSSDLINDRPNDQDADNSDNSDSANEETNDAKSKPTKRGKGVNYDMVCSCKTLETAKKLIANNFDDSVWYYKNRKLGVGFDVIYYECKHKSCNKKLKIIYNPETTIAEIQLSADPHQHENSKPKKNHLDTATINKIKELDRLNLKPTKILIELKDSGLMVPTITHLNNLLKKFRKEKNRGRSVTLRTVKEWLEKHSTIPEDDDSIFVARYEIVTVPDQKFRLFVTTKRLIKFTKYVSL